MAEAAGLALAVVGTADLCFKYGKILIDTSASFKNAEAEVDERVLSVKSYWKRTCTQLDFLKQIWMTLDEEHQNIQNQILKVLVGKLKIAISKLENLLKKRRSSHEAGVHQIAKVRRWKYIFVKPYLDEIIEDLASWQKMFDPSWFLILRVSNSLIDRELSRDGSAVSSFPGVRDFRASAREQPLRQKSVFLPGTGLDYSTLRTISFASVKVAQTSDMSRWFLIDSVPYDSDGDLNLQTQDVRELARKLSYTDLLNLGLLQCRGVIRVLKPDKRTLSSFDFVFRIPNGLSNEPQSLRGCLLAQANHTLTERVKIANQLAKSISYIHTLGFVHKTIRPETILVFQDNKSILGSTFLVGFERFRAADGRTRRAGNSAWEVNLYHHPQRQGAIAEESYVMQHDIYSLGVVLLEIGMWDSFVCYKNDAADPIPGTSLDISLQHPAFRSPTLMKEHLVALAERALPKRMGERYKDVVVNCLTCLDEVNMDFGDPDEFVDEDGVLIGVRYIEKVCTYISKFEMKNMLIRNLDTLKTGRDNYIASLLQW
ncbi:HET-s domain protein [Rutstroemia sp. NJR-2017a BBW]|nr:HET-s domain protein [Rutstroemia sp. NJR-2017a BBW]